MQAPLVVVRVEAEEAIAGLRAARRGIDREVKIGLLKAAELAVEPAREQAPHKTGDLAEHVEAGATARSGFIEVKTREVPYAGLIYWGGTRHDTVRPKSKVALSTPFGPRARIHHGAQAYKPNPFLDRGIAAVRDEVDAAVLDAAVQPFRAFFEVS